MLSILVSILFTNTKIDQEYLFLGMISLIPRANQKVIRLKVKMNIPRVMECFKPINNLKSDAAHSLQAEWTFPLLNFIFQTWTQELSDYKVLVLRYSCANYSRETFQSILSQDLIDLELTLKVFASLILIDQLEYTYKFYSNVD